MGPLAHRVARVDKLVFRESFLIKLELSNGHCWAFGVEVLGVLTLEVARTKEKLGTMMSSTKGTAPTPYRG